MPLPNLGALNAEQRQRLVDAMISGVAKELMDKSLLEAFAFGGPRVDTTFSSATWGIDIATGADETVFRRSSCATPDLRRPGEWTIERRLIEPSRMVIDAEYEVKS